MKRGSLSGGDALTWALLLGVGGFGVYKVAGELLERRAPPATPATPAPAAGPVVTSPGGAVVQPSAPVVVGAGPTAPAGDMVAAVLPVVIVTSSPTGAQVRATAPALLRVMHAGAQTWTGNLQAGASMGVPLADGAVLEVVNSRGLWVAVASGSSPSNVLPVVVGPGQTTQPVPAPDLPAAYVPAVMPPVWQLFKDRFTLPGGHTTQPVRPEVW